MSTKGRKPLSNAEKDLKGTLQNCRINNDAPKSAVTSEPKPVSKLDTLGKKVWSRTVKFLKDNKMMDDMDVDMLSIYCIEMSNYFNHLKMARQIEADNAKAIKELVEMQVDPLSKVDAISKLPRPDRWVRMADSAFEKALKISDRFGFTPATRQKMKVEKGNDKPDAIANKLAPGWRTQAPALA